MKKTIILFLLAALVFIVSCKTARMSVSAPKAEFPVSLTESFYDQNYNLMTADNYDVLYHFKIKYHKASLFGSKKVKLIDISPDVIELMNNYHGVAIVNVSITFKNSDLNEYFLDPICLIVNFGIFTPAHIVAVVEGDVVKMK